MHSMYVRMESDWFLFKCKPALINIFLVVKFALVDHNVCRAVRLTLF